jgi:arylsulfatase A-like enzyme
MARLERWPWMDSITAAAALRGVNELQLGKRGTTDLLNVSFSTLDAIGHDFGPGSREVHDHVLRLDRYIGFFLDSLWKIVPRERTILVLTADHGVNPFPEAVVLEGRSGGKIPLSDIARGLTQRFTNRYRVNFGFDANNSTILADVDALRAWGVDVDSLAAAVAATIAQRAGVAKVFTPASLRTASQDDSAAILWRRQMPPGFGWLALGVAQPGWQFNTGNQADHGTLSSMSRSVPIAFLVPGLRPGTVTRAVETVDIAPTLAALLGLNPLQPLDGKVLAEVRR